MPGGRSPWSTEQGLCRCRDYAQFGGTFGLLLRFAEQRLGRTPSALALPDPARYPNMSGQMAAIVGLLLDRSYVEPALAELMVTPDGAVLSRLEGEPDQRIFIGAEADLRANLRRPGMAAGLDEQEWAMFRERVRQRLGLTPDPPDGG